MNPREKAEFIRTVLASQEEKTKMSAPAEHAYVPKHAFTDFGLTEPLVANIQRKNYSAPTPIQDQAIAPIMAGRDLTGIANTGTGKTAAFLIPLVHKAYKDKSETMLIIAPTRELAVQIHEELLEFSRGMGIYSCLCIGGVFIGHQQQTIKRGVQFIVATPGRLADLIRSRSLSLAGFKTVVLDEADRMVDIGFITEIKFFISQLPKARQSLFFSATVSGKTEEILREFVRDPVTVSVKQGETAGSIDQKIIEIPPGTTKIDHLHDLLNQKDFEKVLIFGRTKWGVERLGRELESRGFKAGTIHGNKRQNQRMRTLESFKRSQIQILLATDLASRGLDIDNVTHVINYDLPETYEDYIHRIGRTGRANKRGIALTFVE